MLAVDTQKKLYAQDFHLWIQNTIQLLREQALEQLDIDNLIEELESMGRSEKREIKTRLVVLIEHLLKLKYWHQEKEYNARGWRNSVIEQRRQIIYALEDSPSLKVFLSEIFLNCYADARKDTLNKCQLTSELLPIDAPFSLAEILDEDFLP